MQTVFLREAITPHQQNAFADVDGGALEGVDALSKRIIATQANDRYSDDLSWQSWYGMYVKVLCNVR